MSAEERGPKIELVDSSLENWGHEGGQQQQRVKGTVGNQGCKSAGSEGPMGRAGRENQCVQCPEEWGLPLGTGSMRQVVERVWEGKQPY